MQVTNEMKCMWKCGWIHVLTLQIKVAGPLSRYDSDLPYQLTQTMILAEDGACAASN